MLELLSPAGSPEAVRAAVQSGADAIYLGYGNFNARRNAVNFDEAALQEAVQYCHLRGVKVYLTLNTLLNDRVMPRSAAALAPSREWMVIWVLAWRGRSGATWRHIRATPKSCTSRASTPIWLT